MRKYGREQSGTPHRHVNSARLATCTGVPNFSGRFLQAKPHAKRFNRKTEFFSEGVNGRYKSINKRCNVALRRNRTFRVTVRRKRCPLNSIKIIRFVDTLCRCNRHTDFRSRTDTSLEILYFTSISLSQENLVSRDSFFCCDFKFLP